jgi:hypothetical protein
MIAQDREKGAADVGILADLLLDDLGVGDAGRGVVLLLTGNGARLAAHTTPQVNRQAITLLRHAVLHCGDVARE